MNTASKVLSMGSGILLFLMIQFSAAAQPQRLNVQVDTLFNTEGRVDKFEIQEAEKYTNGLRELIESHIQNARIEPISKNGVPATFRTGLLIKYQIQKADSGDAQLKFLGLSTGPILKSRPFILIDTESRPHWPWSGEVNAEFTIGTNGQCKSITITGSPNIPPSLRAWAKESISKRTYIPEEINGTPIETLRKEPFAVSFMAQ